MNNFLYAIRAEWISGRRTFLRYSPIVFAFATILFLLPMVLNGLERPWIGSVTKNIFTFYFIFWLYFVLPVYSILVAYLSFNKEHTQGLWKHINTQSILGSTQLIAKHVYAMGYLIASYTMLCFLIIILSSIVGLYYPNLEINFANSIFWLDCCKFGIGMLVIGSSIVSILIVISARFSGFTPTFLTGMLGMLLPIFIKPTDTIALFIPWTIGNAHLLFSWFKTLTPEPWWSVHTVWIMSIIWIAVSLTIHCSLQKKRPLY